MLDVFFLTIVSITCSFEFECKERTGAQQLVGMFKNPDPPGAKEKEVREVQCQSGLSSQVKGGDSTGFNDRPVKSSEKTGKLHTDASEISQLT